MKSEPGQLAGDLEAAYLDAFRTAAGNFSRDWPHDDGDTVILEGFRQALRLASAGHLCHFESDPDFPLLVKMQSLQRQVMLPCADAVYHWARLHGRHRYRLRGTRGSAHLIQIAVYKGSSAHYPDFTIFSERDNFTDPTLAPESVVDVELQSGGAADAMALPEGDCELYVRQYYYDWDTERPASLWIEREDAVYPPPPRSPDALRDGALRLNSWLRIQSAIAQRYVQSFLASDPERIAAISIPGAFEGTRYLNGHFRCRHDQAVIMELAAPDAPYWGFQLSNLQWEALDYYQRQTSLNGRQARIDADGVFRAVICHADPGVPNWLDAGGRTLGLISGRYFKAVTAPEPRLRTVPLDRVRAELPPDTPVVTREQRQCQLRARLRSVHARNCSDQ